MIQWNKVLYILEKEVLSFSFIGIASHIIIIRISYCGVDV